MAAITQQKYALWSRRYGDFSDKDETEAAAVLRASVILAETQATPNVAVSASKAQPSVIIAKPNY